MSVLLSWTVKRAQEEYKSVRFVVMVLTLLSPLLEDHQSLKLVWEQASFMGMVHSDIINNYMRSFNSLNDTQSVKILYIVFHN